MPMIAEVFAAATAPRAPRAPAAASSLCISGARITGRKAAFERGIGHPLFLVK
jgi:hypothetical protein